VLGPVVVLGPVDGEVELDLTLVLDEPAVSASL
jgi:hypothetical protein